MESTPGPKYSTIAPVPPLTVKIPATFKIISKNKNYEISLDDMILISELIIYK